HVALGGIDLLLRVPGVTPSGLLLGPIGDALLAAPVGSDFFSTYSKFRQSLPGIVQRFLPPLHSMGELRGWVNGFCRGFLEGFSRELCGFFSIGRLIQPLIDLARCLFSVGKTI